MSATHSDDSTADTDAQNDAPSGLSIDHLSPEAIAALVDRELPRKAEHRAKVHLVHCKYCRDEVNAQRQAASRLRKHATEVQPPRSLLDRLRRIPEECNQGDEQHDFGIDGRRRPEGITDRMDLMIRKLGRRQR